MANAVYCYDKRPVVRGTGTTLAPTVPLNLQKDDILCVAVWERNATPGTPTVSANSGAISLTSKTSLTVTSTEKITLFWYRYVSTAITSLSVSLTGSARKAAVAFSMRGCITSGDPMTVTTTQGSGSGTGSQTRTGTNVDTTTVANGSAVGANGGYVMGIIGVGAQVSGGFTEPTTPTNGLWNSDELAEFNETSATIHAGAIAGSATNGTTSAAQPGIAFTFTPSATTSWGIITVFFQAQPVPSTPTGATDNFNRTENPIGPPWVPSTTTMAQMQANGTQLAPLAGDAEAFYPINYTANGVAAAQIKIPTNVDFGLGFVDVADDANLKGYFLYGTQFSVDLYMMNRVSGNGAQSVVGGGNQTNGIGSGDSVYLEWDMPNNTIKCWALWASGTQILLFTIVDATWGFAKAQYVIVYNGDASVRFDDFATSIGTIAKSNSSTVSAGARTTVTGSKQDSGSNQVRAGQRITTTPQKNAKGSVTLSAGQRVATSSGRNVNGSSQISAGARISTQSGGSAAGKVSAGARITTSGFKTETKNGVLSAGQRITTSARKNAQRATTLSAGQRITTSGHKVVGAPTLIPGHNSVKLSWAAVPSATAYHVYRDGVLWDSAGTISGTTADMYSVNGYQASWTVTAVVGGVEQPPSTAVVGGGVFPTYAERLLIPLGGANQARGLTFANVTDAIKTVKATFSLPDYDAEVLEFAPMVYWRMRETSAGTVADSSGNSRTATATNITYNTANSILADGGKAYRFGTTSKVVGALDLSAEDRITVVFAGDLTGSASDNDLITHGTDAGTGLAWGIYNSDDAGIGVYVGRNGTYGNFEFTCAVTGNHVYAVEIGTRDQFINLYVDGVRAVVNPGNSRNVPWGSFQNSNLRVGADFSAAASLAGNCDIGEVYVIDRWLTPREHKRLFDNTASQSTGVALKAVVFSDDDHDPSSLLGLSGAQTIPAGSRDLDVTFTFSSSITAPGDCWIGFVSTASTPAWVEAAASDLVDGKAAPVAYSNGAITWDQAMLHGAWTHHMDYTSGTPDPADSSPQRAGIQDTFESHAGKTASTINTGIYLPVPPGSQSDAWFDSNIEAIVRNGSIMMCSASTGGIDQDTILAGDYDESILQVADAMRVQGWPILLRLNWEMNGDWFSWAAAYPGMDAATYIAVWRYIWQLFQDAGAYNVQFGWCPNGEWSTSTLPMDFEDCYPGDAYVDWVGQDSYQWGNLGWDNVFQATLARLQTLAPTKPQFVGETAVSVNSTSPTKAASLAQMFVELGTASTPNWLYKIRWLSVFQSLEPGAAADNQWPIEKGSGAQAAYAAGVADSRYIAAGTGIEKSWPITPQASFGPESTGLAAALVTAPPGEAHSGSATLSAGARITTVGQEGAARAGAVSAGARTTVSGRKGTAQPVAISHGARVTLANSPGSPSAVTVSAGARVQATGVKGAQRGTTVSQGQRITVAAQKGSAGAASASVGQRIQTTGTEGHPTITTASAGARVQATGQKGAAASSAVNNGARITTSVSGSASGSASVSAGARTSASGQKAVGAPSVVTGGARVTTSVQKGSSNPSGASVGVRAVATGSKQAAFPSSVSHGARITVEAGSAQGADVQLRAGARTTVQGRRSSFTLSAGANLQTVGRKGSAQAGPMSAGQRTSSAGRKGAAVALTTSHRPTLTITTATARATSLAIHHAATLTTTASGIRGSSPKLSAGARTSVAGSAQRAGPTALSHGIRITTAQSVGSSSTGTISAGARCTAAGVKSIAVATSVSHGARITLLSGHVGAVALAIHHGARTSVVGFKGGQSAAPSSTGARVTVLTGLVKRAGSTLDSNGARLTLDTSKQSYTVWYESLPVHLVTRTYSGTIVHDPRYGYVAQPKQGHMVRGGRGRLEEPYVGRVH